MGAKKKGVVTTDATKAPINDVKETVVYSETTDAYIAVTHVPIEKYNRLLAAFNKLISRQNDDHVFIMGLKKEAGIE